MRISVKQWQALAGKAPKEKVAIAGGYRSRVQGWRVVGGQRCYFRSLYEINYANFLEWLKEKGDIKDWVYEPKTFGFPKEAYKAGPFYYKPDFLITEKNGSTVWHEVKGWMNPASKKKIKRFHKHFPEEKKIIIIDKTWFSGKGKMLKAVVPGWETLADNTLASSKQG